MRLFARQVSSALAVALSLGLAAWACSTPPPLEPESPQSRPETSTEPAVPAGSVDRGLLEAILRQGPSWALDRIPIEEVMDTGKFVGWRVIDLPMEWAHVDLRPGDVITAINGVALEKPDDLFEAWAAMSAAKEIRITGTRDREPRELVIPIFGAADPALTAKLSAQATATGSAAPSAGPPVADAGAPPPPATPSGSPPPGTLDRKKTIVIKGAEPLESESRVEW